jgi:LacI family transcriptional regulator
MRDSNQPLRTTRKRRARQKTAPTVADVARAAGVSAMTVSRVVNGESNVLPKTREAVQKAIRALRYAPNAAARSLAGGKQCRIALIHSNPSAAYVSEILVGSLAQAVASDAQLAVEQRDEREYAEALVRRIVQHRIDAVLLPPPHCDDANLLAALERSGLPVAQIATGRPAPFAHALMIGDEAAAHAMTAQLIGLGHQRIGFVSGNRNQTASELRRAGYERALRAAGLTVNTDLVAPGDFTYRSGLDAAETLLACIPRPTAIFASNDDMAAAVVAVAHRREITVPGELSVCGFDDSAMATTIWPELTTIRQPVAEMARQAIVLLAASVRSRAATSDTRPRHVRLDFDLVYRNSVGPPPGRT